MILNIDTAKQNKLAAVAEGLQKPQIGSVFSEESRTNKFHRGQTCRFGRMVTDASLQLLEECGIFDSKYQKCY